jgi:hypothetical protein
MANPSDVVDAYLASRFDARRHPVGWRAEIRIAA